MKKSNTYSIRIIAAVSFILGLTGPAVAFAATAPSLGAESSYAIVSSTFTNSNTSPQTIINGDRCDTTPPGTPPLTTTGSITTGGCDPATGSAQLAALNNVVDGLNVQACTSISGTLDAVVVAGHASGTFPPGCYAVTGGMNITSGTSVTLDATATGGSGNVWIFKSTGALTTGASTAGFPSVVLANGADANNVFWAPAAATTLGANFAASATPTFVGNILDAAGISIGQFTNLLGRALAYGGTVLTDANTITVPPITATLRVIKHVINDNGGVAAANEWTLGVTSSNGGTGTGSAVGVESPGTTYTLQAGKAYSVAESGGPTGYSASSAGDCAIASAVGGTTYTCTITNDDIPPALHLRKVVTNDNGGTALNTAWTLAAAGALGSPTNLSGTTPVDSGASFKADTYTLSESGGPTGYAASAWVCVGGTQVGSTITVALGQSATCTITNNDIAPQLTVTKTVNNTHGGTKAVVNFPLFIDGMSVTSGVASTTSAGLHTVSETSDSSYTPTIGGNCAADGTITLVLGDVKVCTIINDDIQGPSNSQTGTITVIKTVINDNGGTKVVSDFPLFVNGLPVVSGVTVRRSSATGYAVTEKNDANYTRTFSGDCDVTGHVDIPSGSTKICVITNDDIGKPMVVPPIPPLIDVVKVPSPLALPNGPGPVIYTYTLKNIGTVPVTNITMVGDTCSPITLVAGDTNGNKKLEVSETWVYTCTAMLSETHKNTVTTTGWANGLSAVDIASATVVVGSSVVPPLIHVTKVPNPLALAVGGESVTYTEKVTNPGTVALSNVRLTDDKCSPMKYISGDTNTDSKLDTTETWVYTCRTNLAKTTTNTATASGDADGLTATDFAIATVVVTSPTLPNTGLPPREKSTWDAFLTLDALLVILLSLYVARRKNLI